MNVDGRSFRGSLSTLWRRSPMQMMAWVTMTLYKPTDTASKT